MKSVMFAVLVLLGAFSQRAQAGATICAIKATAKALVCSGIEDDEARLQCYDDAVAFYRQCVR